MGKPIEDFAEFTERFWAKVDVRGGDECWPWTACISTVAGYATGRKSGYASLGRAWRWPPRCFCH